ncbi:MAG: HPP family protein [Rhodoferax sp.]
MNQKIRALAQHLFLADTPTMSGAERRRSTLGGLLGMGSCAWLLHLIPEGSHWLLAPMGATAVILFALSHSPLAQPWPVIGSFAIATLVGLASAWAIPDTWLAAGVSLSVSIWLMARLNCIHPPAGALALIVVLDGAPTLVQAEKTTELVAFNVLALLFAALVVNNLVLRRRYPYRAPPHKNKLHRTQDAEPLERTGLNHSDLESAVRVLDTFVDVREEELIELYRLAVDHAFERHIGLTCGDIMSRDVVTVEFSTSLNEAWGLLREHHVKALPVVDGFQRLIGVVTVADYLRHIDGSTGTNLAERLQNLLRRTPGMTSKKVEVVGQIMTERVHSARVDTTVAELVHSLTERPLAHIPVLDDKHRVLGVVTQTDMVAALYKRVALSAA